MVCKRICLRQWRQRLGLNIALVLFVSLTQTTSYAIEPGHLYRYIDDNGVKAISNTLPPEYAQNGYEIINRYGRVVKTVDPAVDPELAKEEEARKAEERRLLAEFEVLDRRYSNENEIYAARDRKLAHLDANIAILKSNINTLMSQIDSLTSKAASFERGGRKVPATVLQNLDETRAELASTREMLSSREAEHTEIHGQFERHAELYRKGNLLKSKKLREIKRQSANQTRGGSERK